MNIAPFKEISEVASKRLIDCPLGKLVENKSFVKSISNYDNPLGILCDNYKHCPVDNGKEGAENNGHWEDERGDSIWKPNHDDIPKRMNHEGKTWGEILDKYEIDGITFKDGEPDFSKISKGTVEIKPFSDSRTDNFDKADIELAKQKNCSPEEIANWRKDNSYTWHECKNMKTMQKLPSEVHNNIPHSGGISEAKKGTGE